MKIVSYNVNGIRAALKKGFLDWLVAANPDVICLQEIKAQEDQLDLSLFKAAGYPYTYWFSAQKKGYSGVAILSKTKPKNIVFGTGIESMDFEGRNIRADFSDVSVMSLYLPSGVLDDSIGSGQQKLSRPAMRSRSTPSHTAFLSASSAVAAAIA